MDIFVVHSLLDNPHGDGVQAGVESTHSTEAAAWAAAKEVVENCAEDGDEVVKTSDGYMLEMDDEDNLSSFEACVTKTTLDGS